MCETSWLLPQHDVLPLFRKGLLQKIENGKGIFNFFCTQLPSVVVVQYV